MSGIDLSSLQNALVKLSSQGRTALLPALQAAQNIYGYIPEPVAAEVSRILRIPQSDVYGVIDFYTMLYHQPVGERVLRVCTDLACAAAGGEAVLMGISRYLDISPGGTSADNAFTVERSPCLGLCDHAPAILLGDQPLGPVDPSRPERTLLVEGARSETVVDGTVRILTANCGKGIPTQLHDYIAQGGYEGLKVALQGTPQQVIATVKSAVLVGRGGAAFPTGIKWESVSVSDRETRYIVCNADESEPGTFKDRVLLECDPHLVLEGMLIAAYAAGAHQGYIYVRGEYPYIYTILSHAIDAARRAGYLGENIQGSGFDFDIHLRLGAGAYICGEETALFESIEGKRGFPRIKPPFPTTHGLFNQPTVVNNVETLCNVPFIVKHGAEPYRQLGTHNSPGSKLFCLSGDICRPGVYELPFGTNLRELIFNLGGGVRNGGTLQAVLLGGAAGTFASPDQLDVDLSFEDMQAAGFLLGSGVVMVFDSTRDMREVLVQLGRFFAHESCGKCYPCQLGTQRQYEILKRIASGKTLPGDAAQLADLGWTMADASLCGLGQVAATAVLSAQQLWPDLFQQP
ncbi:MAG: NAD(P)H-dependent oxidoreductase subunit E [Anaerolineales bacterium]|nr:NAD(P)H-dependent oxidoreductase subunit E [Anaerolineales bacterium]